MYTVTLIAKKDLFNGGKCFTKGQQYTFESQVSDWDGSSTYKYIDRVLTNDMKQRHNIGGWHKHFMFFSVEKTGK